MCLRLSRELVLGMRNSQINSNWERGSNGAGGCDSNGEVVDY